jgi:hypothetical protein
MDPEQTGKLVECAEIVDAYGTLAVQVFSLELSEPVKRRNINPQHLGLILRFPMTSIL